MPDAKAIRSPFQLQVRWTDEERQFYEAVRSWTARRAATTGAPVGFTEQMPLRQTASCIPAMARRMRQDHGVGQESIAYYTELGEVPDDMPVEVPGLGLPEPAVDTKFEMLLEGLGQIWQAGLEQVMVFSYFRLTLEYLSERLAGEGYTTRVMHGGVLISDREAIMADFRAGRFQVLLISEVGSEGLDFEFCGALVNYDLPWNPMRIEQRIGRLDRFGQKHEKILIYNFAVDGTIEDRILLRLFERIKVFQQSVGELEPIISEEIDELNRILADSRLSPEEQERRAIEVERALAAKEHLIEELRRNEGSLTQLDKVLIDGFEDDNPGQGRFVGAPELALLVNDLAIRTEGSLVVQPDRSSAVLRGTPKLANLLRANAHRDNSRYPGRLVEQAQDGEEVHLALVPAASDDASQLLHVRHPLIRIAVVSDH